MDFDLVCISEYFNNFPPFFTLHEEQAVTTLSQLVSPPFDLGSKMIKSKLLITSTILTRKFIS